MFHSVRKGPLGLTFSLLVLALGYAGCAESLDNRQGPPELNGDGSIVLPDGGADARVDGNTTGDAGGTIMVTVQSPMAGAVVSGGSVEVTAQVLATMGVIDTASIVAEIAGTAVPAARLTSVGTDTFRGTVSFGALQSGDYTIVVRAMTVDGGQGEGSVAVKINAGPIITFARPSPNEAVVSTLNYDFTVRIAQTLPGINVGTVTAAVGTCNIPLPAPTASGQRNGTFDLNNCVPSLNEGVHNLTVTADDTSAPPVRSIRSTSFTIDRRGPVIVVLDPNAGELVGGIITISANVSDPAGVNPLSVHATVSHSGMNFGVRLDPSGNNVYTGQFDTRRLPNPRLIQFPALEVVADDVLGNHSTTGGIVFTLDNTPPVGDLDPGMVTLYREKASGGLECSEAFDPVGRNGQFDVPNDMETVEAIFDLRAEVRDFGNRGVGSDFEIPAGLSEVTMYVLDDTAQPLIVDTDGDGVCDSINPRVKPVSGMPPGPNHAVALNMTAVPFAGGANYAPPYVVDMSFCSPGTAARPPDNLCGSSEMTISLKDYQTDAPVIYTVPPTAAPPSLLCQGAPFDAQANHVDDGWACVAVAARDNVNNASVSAPLRLCVNKAGGACADPNPAPNCTGTYNPTTQAVTTTPCSIGALEFGNRKLSENK